MSLASACEADAGGALTACWSSEPVSSDFSLVGGTAGARWVGSLRTELHLDGYSRNNSDKLRSPCDSVILSKTYITFYFLVYSLMNAYLM